MTYSIKAEVAMEIISMCMAVAKKEKIYLGDEKIIEKVINEYGEYFKKRMVQ